MNPTSETLQAAINPKSIAILGASDNRNKPGGRFVFYLRKYGYKGKVYPINPNRSEVQGYRSYPSLEALDEIPEMAIIVLADKDVPQAVANCAGRGVKCAVVISAGFGETGGEGLRAQNEMVATARRSGMRIVGPNSQGLANFSTGAVANFSTMFMEVEPADGPVAIISQSGGASVMPYALLRQRDIGVRYLLATGNDADLTVSELALPVAADPDIRLIILYTETIRDPDNLAAAAEVARQRGVPIIALKAGRTASGMAAAYSHTGALVNEDRVVEAFFARHGIWRVRDVHGLVNAVDLYLKGWRPGGRRLVIISNSGAFCVMAADTAETLGLPLASLSEKTQQRLRQVLPGFAGAKNPIDLTAALLTDSRMLGRVLPILADDPEADLILFGLPVAGEGYDVEAFASDIASFVETTNKPVVIAATQATTLSFFKVRGLPCFVNETDALSALNQFSAHLRLIQQSLPRPAAPRSFSIPLGSSRFLSEAQSLRLLAEAGLPVVPFQLCLSRDDAVAAFHDLGGPVAVKACSEALPHKTEYGLIFLKLDSAEAVLCAFDDCMEGMKRLGIAAEGVIVAKMVSGRREFALGAKLDPVFGPAVMVGDGGKYVEAMPDFALLIPPFTEEEVRDALMRLRIAPLLKGVRGEPPLDVRRLSQAAVALGSFIIGADHKVASVDINPVIVGAEGEGAFVVDGLLERAAADVDSAARP